ncbi:MAG: hypothetical protein U1E73_11305 [Planctomycetota bacterium]
MNQILLRAAIAAVSLVAVAPAQSTGLRTHYRLVSAVLSQSTSTNYINHDSGWVVGPALLSADANANQVGACLANGLCNVFASYGELRVLATGYASSCASSGMALAFDEWSGGMPKAQFLDVLVVQSATLPAGTPVQVDVAMDFIGTAVATGTSPYSTFGANLLIGGSPVLLAPATGHTTAVVATTVGANLFINGQLRVTLGDGALAGGSTYYADLRAQFAISTTTPGATLTAMSGANYGSLPARAVSFGSGCGAAPPTLTATPPRLGTTCALTVSGAPANAPVLLGFCIGGVTPSPAGACTLYIDPNRSVVALAGIASPSGQLVHTLAIPSIPQFAGLWLTSQAAPLAANGPFLGAAELSNGITLTLGS